MRVELVVETNDGRKFRNVCAAPKGFWGTVIDPAEHMAKIRDCMSMEFDDARIQDYISTVRRLEHLTPGEMTEFFGFLRGGKPD